MKRITMILVAISLVVATAAQAVPPQMNYQGQLFLNGSPAVGPVSVTFRLYDAQTGGTLLWNETDVVQVQNGLFSTILGDGTTLPYLPFSGQTLWLEMEVSGTTLSPRTQFVSTPYAYRSQRADTADVAITALGGGSQGPWSDDGTRVVVLNRKVGVNTASGNAAFDVFMGPNSQALNVNAGYGDGVTGSYTANYLSAAYGTNSTGNLTGLLVDVQHGGPGNATAATFAGGDVYLTRPGNEFLRIEGSGQNGQVRVDLEADGGRNYSLNSRIGGTFDISDETANTSPFLIQGGASTNALNILSNGRVGVNHLTPGTGLGIAGYGQNEAGIELVNIFPGSGTWQILSGNDNSLRFWSNTLNSYVMTLKADGSMCVTGQKNRLVHDEKFGDLYYNSLESGEAIFSTSGRAKLNKGRCHVELNPKWLAGVTINEQYPLDVASVVFYGPHGNWYAVPGQLGFTIIDPSGSNSEFFWTVQARQKGYEDVYLNRKQPTAAK